MYKKMVIAITLLWSVSAFATPSSGELFKAIAMRLSYMEDVARFKAKHHKPIEDIQREVQVIDKAKQKAQQAGLDPSTVEAFIRAQISAAKAIQYRHRADWLANKKSLALEGKDLHTEIRPALLQLGDQIVLLLKQYLETGKGFSDATHAEFMAKVEVIHLSTADKESIYRSLSSVQLLTAP